MGKWFARLAILLVALAILAPLALVGFAAYQGRAMRTEVEYLAAHATPLDLRRADGAIKLSGHDYAKRLFLLGEAHGVRVGQRLDLAMARHLNTVVGMRYYVAEIDPAQAAWFNAYLKTGDEKRLDRVFSFWARERYQWGNQDFRSKVIAMRQFNLSLAPERRVQFIGMDRLQDAELACAYLEELISQVRSAQAWEGEARLRAALAQDRACEDASRDGPLAIAGETLAQTLPDAPPPGVERDTWRALTNMIAMLDDRRRLDNRVQMIVAAFERLGADPDFVGEKFYGLWGMFHVMQAPVSGAEPMAFILQQKGAFENQVVSSAIFNFDSAMMMPGGAIPFLEADASGYATMDYSMDDPILSMLTGVGSVTSAMQSDTTLFWLSARVTPYGKGSKRLARLHGVFGLLQPFDVETNKAPKDGALNYLIAARGFPATKPFPVR